MIKQALADQGIASVYLSNRDSVFTSSVAQDLQRLLQAVLTPENDRALRASLASELFALDAASLTHSITMKSCGKMQLMSSKNIANFGFNVGYYPCCAR